MLGLFSRYVEDVDHKVVKVTSEEGKKLLRSVENKKSKLMISVEPRKVILNDEGLSYTKTTEGFSCIDQYGYKEHSWEEHLCEVAGLNMWDVKKSLPFQKDRFKYYTKYLGATPKKFISMFNASMVRAHIPDEFYTLANKLIKGSRGHYDKHALNSLNKNKQVIRECIEDGMVNIVPFILFLRKTSFWGETPVTVSNLRKIFGKGLWRRILKNSVSRNKMIALAKDSARNNLSLAELQELPSSLLPRVRNSFVCSPIEANVLKRMKVLTKKDLHHKICNTISDTILMCNKLGKDLPKQHTKWDYPKWKEHHDYYLEQIKLQKYSKDVFKSVENLNKEYISSSGNYKAILLDNAFDIKTEGDVMHHCVGGYSWDVKIGKYLVLSILNKEGKRSSTLGLNVVDNVAYFSQHYGHCNEKVVCQEEKLFAKNIIKDLNKQFKTNKEN